MPRLLLGHMRAASGDLGGWGAGHALPNTAVRSCCPCSHSCRGCRLQEQVGLRFRAQEDVLREQPRPAFEALGAPLGRSFAISCYAPASVYIAWRTGTASKTV